MKSLLTPPSVVSLNESSALLDKLSTQQYLHPHREVRRVLEHAALQLEYCPASVGRAIQWLGIDAGSAVGRVRRTELAQLARSVHRFSKQMRNPSASRTFTPAEL